MRITYDAKADAAYIYLSDTGEKSAKTYPCDPSEVQGMINLDFNAANQLIGIEVLGASKRLPKALLESAEKIG
jgi:uncharacterized protein YuzE